MHFDERLSRKQYIEWNGPKYEPAEIILSATKLPFSNQFVWVITRAPAPLLFVSTMVINIIFNINLTYSMGGSKTFRRHDCFG